MLYHCMPSEFTQYKNIKLQIQTKPKQKQKKNKAKKVLETTMDCTKLVLMATKIISDRYSSLRSSIYGAGHN